MANLTILVASFFAFLFLVDASIYRTTVIVDETDPNDDNPSTEQRCREQVQLQQNLRQCQELFMREIRSRGRRADNEYQYHRQDPLRGCCQQLQRLDAQCRCNGLRMAIRQQRSRGQLEAQEMMGALRLAEDLPSRCGVSPRQCQFSSRWLE